MKRFFSVRNILFYLLTLVLFFLLGTITSGLAGAGKNQGLASGAIVLGYGVIAGFIAFILAIISVQVIKEKLVKSLNIIFACIIAIIIIILIYRFQTRESSESNNLQIKKETTVFHSSFRNKQIRFIADDTLPNGFGMWT